MLPYGQKPGFNDTCEQCGRDLHVCRMCRFYSPGAHWDCRETIEERVSDKERRNHCEFFMVDDRFIDTGTDQSLKTSDSRRKFDALFKD